MKPHLKNWISLIDRRLGPSSKKKSLKYAMSDQDFKNKYIGRMNWKMCFAYLTSRLF
ncbi:hypothetical protein AB4K20DRAFT_1923364 [Rhizopus microsporus]